MSYNFNLKKDNGKMTVQVDTAALYGYFERNSDGAGGGLWFVAVPGSEKDLELIDYDGMACLPMSVIEALRDWGIKVGEEFE